MIKMASARMGLCFRLNHRCCLMKIDEGKQGLHVFWPGVFLGHLGAIYQQSASNTAYAELHSSRTSQNWSCHGCRGTGVFGSAGLWQLHQPSVRWLRVWQIN